MTSQFSYSTLAQSIVSSRTKRSIDGLLMVVLLIVVANQLFSVRIEKTKVVLSTLELFP